MFTDLGSAATWFMRRLGFGVCTALAAVWVGLVLEAAGEVGWPDNQWNLAPGRMATRKFYS